jgi:hypothetical protein
MESPNSPSPSSSIGETRDTDILFFVGVPLMLVALLVFVAIYYYRREENKRKLLMQLTRRDRAMRRISVVKECSSERVQKKSSSISTETTCDV